MTLAQAIFFSCLGFLRAGIVYEQELNKIFNVEISKRWEGISKHFYKYFLIVYEFETDRQDRQRERKSEKVTVRLTDNWQDRLIRQKERQKDGQDIQIRQAERGIRQTEKQKTEQQKECAYICTKIFQKSKCCQLTASNQDFGRVPGRHFLNLPVHKVLIAFVCKKAS